jgi:hypothetical protein
VSQENFAAWLGFGGFTILTFRSASIQMSLETIPVHFRTGETIRIDERLGERPTSPDHLTVPLTDLVALRKLDASGIEFEGLRWHSEGLSSLRMKIGANTMVQITINPDDLSSVHVLDPASADENENGIKGFLQNDPRVAKMTLSEYREYKELAAAGPTAKANFVIVT